MEDLKNILDEILKKNNLFVDFKLKKIQTKWKEIAGEKIYQVTKPEKIDKNVLIILCNHPGWVTTLNQFKSELLKKIIAFSQLSDIIDIKFKFGSFDID